MAGFFASSYGLADLAFSSAGTRAVVGRPMHQEAALMVKQLGGDPSSFAARQFTPKIAAEADLLLTMTRAHRESVLERQPRFLHRTYTLSEAACISVEPGISTIAEFAEVRPRMAGRALADIPDPIGQSSEVFAAAASQIVDRLLPIVELLRRTHQL